MKKILIETINRQKKLMGLLVENNGNLQKLIVLIDEFLTANKSTFRDAELPTQTVQFLQRKRINDLIELRAALLSGLRTSALTNANVDDVYAKLMSTLTRNMSNPGFDPITSKVFPDILDELSPSEGARLYKIYLDLKDSPDNFAKIRFLSMLKDAKAGDPIISYAKRTLNITSDAVENSVKTWDTFFNGVKMGLAQIPIIGNISAIKQKLMIHYTSGLKPFRELNNKFAGLLNEYKELVLDEPLKADQLVDEITETLSQMTLVSGNNMKVIYENWKKELPEEWFATLGDISSQEFRDVFSKFEKGVAKVEPTDVIISRAQAFWKMFKRPPYADAKWHPFDKYLKQRTLNTLQRLTSTFLFMDPRKFSEHVLNKKLMGTSRWLGKGTIDRILTLAYYPIAFATIYTLLEYLEGKDWVPIPGIDDKKAKAHIGDKDSSFYNLLKVWSDNMVRGAIFGTGRFLSVEGQSPALSFLLSDSFAVDQTAEGGNESIGTIERLRAALNEWKDRATKSRSELDSIESGLKIPPNIQRQIDSLKQLIPTEQQIDTAVNNMDNISF